MGSMESSTTIPMEPDVETVCKDAFMSASGRSYEGNVNNFIAIVEDFRWKVASIWCVSQRLQPGFIMSLSNILVSVFNY